MGSEQSLWGRRIRGGERAVGDGGGHCGRAESEAMWGKTQEGRDEKRTKAAEGRWGSEEMRMRRFRRAGTGSVEWEGCWWLNQW